MKMLEAGLVYMCRTIQDGVPPQDQRARRFVFRGKGMTGFAIVLYYQLHATKMGTWDIKHG